MEGPPAWELAKENVQPLARGRDPAALAKTLQVREDAPVADKGGDPDGRDQTEWEQRRLWYEAKIADNSGDDPLANWVGYARWLQDTFPSGDPSPDGRYDSARIIEATCKTFVGIERYRNDSRYVRTWVRFATIAKNDLEILRYMETNRIGDELAIYYEARAVAHEQKKEHALASTTYKQGIQRMAHPVDRLRERHKAFEERMVKRMERRKRRENRANASQPAPSRSRAALGGLGSVAGSHRPTSAIQPTTRPASHNLKPNIPSSTPGGFQIFSDTPAAAPSKPDERGVGHFPAQLTAAKENNCPISTWQEAAGVVNFSPREERTGLKFVIHADPHTSSSPDFKAPPRDTQLGIHADADPASMSGVSPRQTQPSFSIHVDKKSTDPPGAGGHEIQPVPHGETKPETSPKIVALPSSDNGVAPEDSTTMPAAPTAEEAPEKKSDEQVSESRKRVASSPHPTPMNPKRPLATETKEKPEAQSTRTSPALVRRLAFDAGVPSSPTINTKQAMEEVGLMMDSTYPIERTEDDTLIIPAPVNSVAPAFTIFQDSANEAPRTDNTTKDIDEEDKENALGGPRAAISPNSPLDDNAVLRPRPDLEANPETVEYEQVDYIEEPIIGDPAKKLSPIAEEVAGQTTDVVEQTREALSSTQLAITASSRTSREAVDPFSESVRYEIEEKLWDWYEESPNLHFDGKVARLRKGAVCTVGDRNNSFIEICVQKILGEGRYAKVYLVEPLKASDPALMNEDDDDSCELALKVQKPSCLWEYYVCTELPKRMPANLKPSVNNAIAIFEASEGNEMTSYFLMNAGDNGTLHDLVNLYRRDGETVTTMDETLVMFFAIELLRMIEGVHSAGFIHTDIKPDNLLVRCVVLAQPLGSWAPEGQDGWDGVGLTLIDFGRSLDLNTYNEVCGTTLFEGNHGADTFACQEMLSGEPWRFQSDTYALAATIHLLLTGRDMSTEYTNGVVKPSLQLKRYWQKSLWEEVFGTLTNLGTGTAEDSIHAMKALRQKLEAHLLSNPSKRKELRGLVMRMAIMLREANPADVTGTV